MRLRGEAAWLGCGVWLRGQVAGLGCGVRLWGQAVGLGCGPATALKRPPISLPVLTFYGKLRPEMRHFAHAPVPPPWPTKVRVQVVKSTDQWHFNKDKETDEAGEAGLFDDSEDEDSDVVCLPVLVRDVCCATNVMSPL